MTIKTILAYDFFHHILQKHNRHFYVCWIQMVVYDSFTLCFLFGRTH